MVKYFPILPTVLVYKIFELKIEFEKMEKKTQELKKFKELIESYRDIKDEFIFDLRKQNFESLSNFAVCLQRFSMKRKDSFMNSSADMDYLMNIYEGLQENFDSGKSLIVLHDDFTFDFGSIVINPDDPSLEDEDITLACFVERFVELCEISDKKTEKKINDRLTVYETSYKLFDYNNWNLVRQENVLVEDEFSSDTLEKILLVKF
jgi:hypothetical protein